jgi:hypothetical protein
MQADLLRRNDEAGKVKAIVAAQFKNLAKEVTKKHQQEIRQLKLRVGQQEQSLAMAIIQLDKANVAVANLEERQPIRRNRGDGFETTNQRFRVAHGVHAAGLPHGLARDSGLQFGFLATHPNSAVAEAALP